MAAFLVLVSAIVGFVVYAVLATIFSGFVLVDLWAWFIMPVFHIGALSIPQAIGISCIVGYLTHQIPTNKTTETGINIMLTGFFKILFTWGFGWIIHQFI